MENRQRTVGWADIHQHTGAIVDCCQTFALAGAGIGAGGLMPSSLPRLELKTESWQDALRSASSWNEPQAWR